MHAEFLYDESLKSYHSHIYMLTLLDSPRISTRLNYGKSATNVVITGMATREKRCGVLQDKLWQEAIATLFWLVLQMQ